MPRETKPRLANRRQALALAAAGLALPYASAQAQAAYPAKSIKLLVGYPPGGFTDVTARLIGQKLQERLGVSVTVENKPGANGMIAVENLARSPGDGSTFAVVIAAHAANTTLYPKLAYDPKKDLAAVSLIGLSPLVAAVNNDAPFKTAAELLAYAQKNPGKISFASSGNGSAAHLTTELLKSQTRSFMVHIPYRGAAAALTDLMGGQVQLFFDAAQGLINPGKSGKVRLIGVAADKRLPVLPEVPTFIEQGITGFTGSTWAMLLAPAAAPKELVRRVSDEVASIVRSDEVKKRLEAMGTVPVGGTPGEAEAFLDAETAKWAQVIRGAKVTLD